jgi:hypothetical protein
MSDENPRTIRQGDGRDVLNLEFAYSPNIYFFCHLSYLTGLDVHLLQIHIYLFVVYLTTLSVVQTIQRRMVG